MWAESTTLADHPCILQHRQVRGWQLHEIDTRLADYRQQQATVDVYRLHPFHQLDIHEVVALARYSVDYWHTQLATYDARSALWSGSRIVRRFRLYKPADLAAVFCSEYIAAVLRRLNRLSPADNPARFSPATLLRELVHAGTYARQRTIHHDHQRFHNRELFTEAA
ncbi:MAG: hypothetical protein R3B90_21815 [Planctomycetaceae bacterium]